MLAVTLKILGIFGNGEVKVLKDLFAECLAIPTGAAYTS